jgi:hypothetical protein
MRQPEVDVYKLLLPEVNANYIAAFLALAEHSLYSPTESKVGG